MANVLDGLWQLIGKNGETWDPSITRIAGMGLPPARRASVQTPTRHGSAELGFVLDDREIIIGLMWRPWGTLAAGRRRKPYKTLNYLNNPVTLRRTLDNQECWELRQLYYNGGMEGDSAQAFDEAEFAAVSFICRDPAWYDTREKTITIEYGDMDHSLYSDSIRLTNTEGLYTDGDWYTYPTIAITGPCTWFELTSTTTGQRLRYFGEVVGGEVVTICTNPHAAYLSAQSDAFGSVRQYIYPSDDFGGFCLWPDPLAAAGCNVWDIETEGMNSESQIVLTWEDRYQGG